MNVTIIKSLTGKYAGFAHDAPHPVLLGGSEFPNMRAYLEYMKDRFHKDWDNTVSDSKSPYNGEIRRVAAEHYGMLLKFGLIERGIIKSSQGFKPDARVRKQQVLQSILKSTQSMLFATEDGNMNVMLTDLRSYAEDGYSMFYKP